MGALITCSRRTPPPPPPHCARDSTGIAALGSAGTESRVVILQDLRRGHFARLTARVRLGWTLCVGCWEDCSCTEELCKCLSHGTRLRAPFSVYELDVCVYC